MNNITWAVVANRESAHFFEIAVGHTPILINTLPNPRGRLTNREIDSDRPGRTKDRFGSARHSMMRSRSPTEQVTVDFAKEISRAIEKARSKGAFHKLYLVAPSKLLGELKFCLEPITQNLIAESFHKNLREEDMDKKLMKLIYGETPHWRQRKNLTYA